MAIAGRLFAVEGATASGKTTLLKKLSAEGYCIIRGIVSQNPAENKSLLVASQEIVGDTVFNVREILTKPPEEIAAIIKKSVEVARLQQDEAVRRKNEGETVFLNRSAFSLIALLRIPLKIAEPEKREEVERFTARILTEPIQLRSDLLHQLDGIILMQNASIGGREREGMAGIQNIEAANIAEQLKGINSIPIVELNAITMSPKEELAFVRERLLS